MPSFFKVFMISIEEIIRESSLCHLCLSNVSEGEQEMKELIQSITRWVEDEKKRKMGV